jgi:hypothetical protein
VPLDAAMVLKETLEVLFKDVQKYTNSVIGADELFPAFVAVVIHSDVPELYRYLKFLHCFLSEHDKTGEVAYCLITLEGTSFRIGYGVDGI